jgi:protein CpxP
MKKILLICGLFIASIAAGHAQGTQTVTSSDPAIKAKALQKQLKLSDDQTTKVSTIYSESAKKFDKIKVEDHGNTDKMIVAVAPLRTATIKKIKGVLTHSQSVKYDALLKDKNNTALNGGWSGGWSDTESGS